MKTVNQAILKCNKKAWQEIKTIKNAPNMLCAEHAIEVALAKTFGIWNQGLLILEMKRLGRMGQLEAHIRIHRANWDRWVSEVRHYLVGMIPVRMHTTLMYQRLIGRL